MSLGALITGAFLLDLLVFGARRRMGVWQIIAGWGYGLAPHATWVVPTLVCWAALREWLGIEAFLIVPFWVLLTPIFWTVSRLFAYRWFLGPFQWTELLWLTAGPILLTVVTLNLS